MKRFSLLFFLPLLLIPLAGQASEVDYGDSIPVSCAATIMRTPTQLAVPKPPDLAQKTLVLKVWPERKKPAILYCDDGLVCKFVYQKKRAPLAVPDLRTRCVGA